MAPTVVALDAASKAKLAELQKGFQDAGGAAGPPLDAQASSKLKSELAQLHLILWQLSANAPRRSPATATSSNAFIEELQFSRDVLTLAAHLALREQNLKAFHSYAVQLYAVHQNSQDVTSPSADEYGVIGMLLMVHLVNNNLGEFHLTIEQLPAKWRSASSDINFPIELERNLTEGNFTKVLEAQSAMPSPHYQAVLDKLLSALRDASADTLELSYAHINIDEASRRLFLKSPAALPEFLAARNRKNAALVGGTAAACSMLPLHNTTAVHNAVGGTKARGAAALGGSGTQLGHAGQPAAVFGSAFKRAELNALTDQPAAKLIRWELSGDRLVFVEEAIIGKGGYLSRERREVDSLAVLHNVLGYASELERIV